MTEKWRKMADDKIRHAILLLCCAYFSVSHFSVSHFSVSHFSVSHFSVWF